MSKIKTKKKKSNTRGKPLDIDGLYKKAGKKIPKLRVKEAIEDSSMSYGVIAEKLGQSTTTIYKMTRAKNLSFHSLKQIAFALNIDIKKLIQ